jgi:Flp pilus assembly protein CpaB
VARPQSTRLLLIGLAILLVGTGLVFAVLKSSNDSKAKPSLTGGATATTTKVAPVVTQSTPASVVIPEGMQAVAVQAPFVQGVAGYAHPGDQVDIYATVEKGPPRPPAGPPYAKLIQQHVAVLAVTAPPPEAGTGNATYLLALPADAAEQVIFFAKFESVWLTIVPKDQRPVSTAGHGYVTPQ